MKRVRVLFSATGLVCFAFRNEIKGGGWERQTDRQTETERDRERHRHRHRHRQRQRDRENSNSKTLFYKDCSLGSVKNLTTTNENLKQE